MGDEVERWSNSGERAPDLLTVSQTALTMQLGRSTTYALVRRFVETDGAEGIPALLVGGQYRIPRARLEVMTGGPITWPPAPRQRTPRRRTLESSEGGGAPTVSPVAQTEIGTDDVDTDADIAVVFDTDPATNAHIASTSLREAPIAEPTHGALDELWSQQFLPFEG